MKPIHIKTIHPTGWPITFEIDPADPKLSQLIRQLYTLGFRPDIAGDTWMRTPEGLPICPKHGEVMSKREMQGDTWYSHALIDQTSGEKLYCRGYAGKSSPGFALKTYNTPDNDPDGRNAHKNSHVPDPLATARLEPVETAVASKNNSNGHKPIPPVLRDSATKPTLQEVLDEANDALFS